MANQLSVHSCQPQNSISSLFHWSATWRSHLRYTRSLHIFDQDYRGLSAAGLAGVPHYAIGNQSTTAFRLIRQQTAQAGPSTALNGRPAASSVDLPPQMSTLICDAGLKLRSHRNHHACVFRCCEITNRCRTKTAILSSLWRCVCWDYIRFFQTQKASPSFWPLNLHDQSAIVAVLICFFPYK